MKHTRSSAEVAIRDDVVTWIRSNRPSARIIHEMNVDDGQCRADVVAASPEEILTFEIKSKRDKLTRLAEQAKRFSAVSHHFVAVLDEKWFEEKQDRYGGTFLEFSPKLDEALSGKSYKYNLWRHPAVEPERGRNWYASEIMTWSDPARPAFGPRDRDQQPHAYRMLNLLWKAELLAEARGYGLDVVTRDTIPQIIRKMVWSCTGAELCQAVCRQLRRRDFAEADAPVFDTVEAVAPVAPVKATEPQLSMFEGAAE